MRNCLDVIWPTSDDHVSEGAHLGVAYKGFLECFLPLWGQVSIVYGNVQQDVRSRTWAEPGECVRQGRFLTGVVMDGVILALEAQ